MGDSIEQAILSDFEEKLKQAAKYGGKIGLKLSKLSVELFEEAFNKIKEIADGKPLNSITYGDMAKSDVLKSVDINAMPDEIKNVLDKNKIKYSIKQSDKDGMYTVFFNAKDTVKLDKAIKEMIKNQMNNKDKGKKGLDEVLSVENQHQSTKTVEKDIAR